MKRNKKPLSKTFETIDNPFDIAWNVVLSTDSRQARIRNKKKKERLGDISDEGLKRERTSGQTRLIFLYRIIMQFKN